MKIYIDLVFLQDIIIMSVLLLLVSKVINLKVKIIRIFVVSSISSMISILILIFLPTSYDNLFIKLILSFFTVKYGLNVKKNSTIFQKVVIFWMVALLLGGIQIFVEGNIVQTLFLLGLMGMSMIYCKKSWKKKLLLESAICLLEFQYHGKRYLLKALLDTGHEVKTIYGEDVIFVRDNLIEEGGERQKRIVSYKTISGIENKIGTKIYHIKIQYGERKVCNNAVIVRTPNISQNYDAIVSYDLIEGGISDGDISFNERKGQEIMD